ncbi:MAG: chemotaxis protein CheX [Rhodoferax sp.]
MGDFATDAILMFPEEHQLHLTRMMVGDELPDAELPDVAQDALGELGNIVLNAVISNLASSLHMALEGSIPVVEFLTADEILVHRSTGDAVDDEAAPVLTLMIDFELSAQRVGGYLAFLLDSDSSQTLLRHLGAYIQGN